MTGSVIYYPGYAQVQVSQTPLIRQIESITQANPMVVTTSVDHGYQVGQNIRFIIPGNFGMSQLNTVNCDILEVTSNTITCDLDSTNFYPFSYPSPLPMSYSLPYTIPNAEGKLRVNPLPYGNQDGFQATVRNSELPTSGAG